MFEVQSNETERTKQNIKKKRVIWTNIKHKDSVIQQDLKAYEMKFNYFVSFTIFHVLDSIIETANKSMK